jgi:hypothetical protein
MTKDKKLDKYGNDLEQESIADIYLFYPISDILLGPLHNLGLKPNHITMMSTLFSIIAFYYYFYNDLLLTLIFYFLGYLLDCIDGRMARKYNQGSILGMILDSTSDVLSNLPFLLIIILKSIYSIKNYGIVHNHKFYLFMILSIICFYFSVAFGINEAIESYLKTNSDNFYEYKLKIIKKENWDKTLIGKIFLNIYKQSYDSYRKIFPDEINKDNIKLVRKRLLNLKEFGPGNYNVLLMLMLSLYS